MLFTDSHATSIDLSVHLAFLQNRIRSDYEWDIDLGTKVP
jgi:hypothetical protein